jgi:spore germination cell wall hydrolase CwlJ-like protein
MTGIVKTRLIAALLLTMLAVVPAGADTPVNVALEIARRVPDAPYARHEVDMLARMVWGEALGCSEEEQALCVWTAINRLEDGRFGGSIAEVLTAPGQFAGYSRKNPVAREIREVVKKCLTTWMRGESAPLLAPYAKKRPYLYFDGGHLDERGKPHNFFM